MTPAQQMPSLRRPMPGMAITASAPPPPDLPASSDPTAKDRPATAERQPAADRPTPAAKNPASRTRRRRGADTAAPRAAGEAPRRYPAADYATTRLVNFRIPVDLHDRFRQLVQDVEREHPRLRRPSLTELVIGLLEEGPQTADEVAELIRRKRAAEHERAER